MSTPGSQAWDRVDQLVREFYRDRESDRAATPEAFAAKHPELEQQILETLHIGDALEPLFQRQALGAGTAFDGLRLLRRLGGGSFGDVFVAWEDDPGREVAVKVLRFVHLASDNVRARFRREAEIVGRLAHPNLVPLFRTGEVADAPYLVMELVHGEPLSVLEPPPTDAAQRARLRALVDVCAAVAHAHARGVIHRDLKPSNMVMDTEGRLRVVDFGLARLEDGLVSHSMIVGSPGYMSPEQARGEKATVASDVFGLAATIAFAISGTPGLAGAREIADPDLREVVLRGLRERPEQRFASAAALGDAVARWLAGRRQGWWRRRRVLAAAIPLFAGIAAWSIHGWAATPGAAVLHPSAPAGARLVVVDSRRDIVSEGTSAVSVPPGTYCVVASQTNCLPAERQVQVLPGDDARVELAPVPHELWSRTEGLTLDAQAHLETAVFPDVDGDGLHDLLVRDWTTAHVLSGATGRTRASATLADSAARWRTVTSLVPGPDEPELIAVLEAVQLPPFRLRLERWRWQHDRLERLQSIETEPLHGGTAVLVPFATVHRWLVPLGNGALVFGFEPAPSWRPITRPASSVQTTHVTLRGVDGSERGAFLWSDGVLAMFDPEGHQTEQVALFDAGEVTMAKQRAMLAWRGRAVAMRMSPSGDEHFVVLGADGVLRCVDARGTVTRHAGPHDGELLGFAASGAGEDVLLIRQGGRVLEYRLEPDGMFAVGEQLDGGEFAPLLVTGLAGATRTMISLGERQTFDVVAQGRVGWRIDGPARLPRRGWWCDTGGADLNGDGALDLFAALPNGALAVAGIPGDDYAAFRCGLEFSYACPTLLDVDADGVTDVVLGGRTEGGAGPGQLFALSGRDLAPLWSTTVSYAFDTTPVHWSHDGELRLLVADPRGELACLRARDGADVWRAQPGAADRPAETAAIGNACLVGTAGAKHSVIVAGQFGVVSAFAAADGAPLWQRAIASHAERAIMSTPIAVQRDKRVAVVVVIRLPTPTLFALDLETGETLADVPLPFGDDVREDAQLCTATPVLLDAARGHILLASEGGLLATVCLWPHCQLLGRWSVRDPDTDLPAIHATPMPIGSGSGAGHVIVSDSNGHVYCTRLAGTTGVLDAIRRWDVDVGLEAVGRMDVVDLDGDGWLDVVTVSRTGNLLVLSGDTGGALFRHRIGAACKGGVCVTQGRDGAPYAVAGSLDGWVKRVRLAMPSQKVFGHGTARARRTGWLGVSDW